MYGLCFRAHMALSAMKQRAGAGYWRHALGSLQEPEVRVFVCPPRVQEPHARLAARVAMELPVRRRLIPNKGAI